MWKQRTALRGESVDFISEIIFQADGIIVMVSKVRPRGGVKHNLMAQFGESFSEGRHRPRRAAGFALERGHYLQYPQGIHGSFAASADRAPYLHASI